MRLQILERNMQGRTLHAITVAFGIRLQLLPSAMLPKTCNRFLRIKSDGASRVLLQVLGRSLWPHRTFGLTCYICAEDLQALYTAVPAMLPQCSVGAATLSQRRLLDDALWSLKMSLQVRHICLLMLGAVQRYVGASKALKALKTLNLLGVWILNCSCAVANVDCARTGTGTASEEPKGDAGCQ